MRITFDDRSYVEFFYDQIAKTVTVIQGSVNKIDGKRYLSVSSSNVTMDQFSAMVDDIKSKMSSQEAG